METPDPATQERALGAQSLQESGPALALLRSLPWFPILQGRAQTHFQHSSHHILGLFYPHDDPEKSITILFPLGVRETEPQRG